MLLSRVYCISSKSSKIRVFELRFNRKNTPCQHLGVFGFVEIVLFIRIFVLKSNKQKSHSEMNGF